MRWFRFWLSRHLIHLGLAVMPQGSAKDELTEVLWSWGRHVAATIAKIHNDGNTVIRRVH